MRAKIIVIGRTYLTFEFSSFAFIPNIGEKIIITDYDKKQLEFTVVDRIFHVNMNEEECVHLFVTDYAKT